MTLHSPSLMLIIGYVVYWFELYVLNKGNGRTSLLATALAGTIFILYLYRDRVRIMDTLQQAFAAIFNLRNRFLRIVALAGVLLSFSILILVGLAAFSVPHMSQEYDALNYHLTLPRQHLIQHSFAHISWSSADLFLLPLNFALAPYWFLSDLPNKVPQFLFTIGLAGILVRLVQRWSSNKWKAAGLILAAFLGSHGLNIQMGTAMLDLVLAYLFLASLDSFLSGRMGLAAVEFAFFFWSKPFVPLQMTLIVSLMAVLVWVSKWTGITEWSWTFSDRISESRRKEYWKDAQKGILLFAVFSVAVGGPFVFKSLCYSGTPLYPFAPGFFKTNSEILDKTEHWKSLEQAARVHRNAKNAYGSGRGLIEFAKHVWVLAIPEKNVNNRFDYPMGLPYLLLLGPFLYFFIKGLSERKFSFIPAVATLFWITWWFGSRQARFLYVPLLLIYVSVGSRWDYSARVLGCCLLVGLLLSAVSLLRAYKHSFFVPPETYMRSRDIEMIELNKKYAGQKLTAPIELDYADVAYAEFPVFVTKQVFPFVVTGKQ